MKYVEVYFACNPATETITDVLSAELSEIGFESFVTLENGLTAYIPETSFSENKINDVLQNFLLDCRINFSFNLLEDKNWNEEWEKNYFRPIDVDGRYLIHSSFHNVEGDYERKILIDPKMAFGTGHHQTTQLVFKEILRMDVSGKSVLDMGCGTAVLAILASMRGANPVLAVDIDEWAYNNALENIRLNGIANIRVCLGGAETIGKETFDVVLANINRNILLQDMPKYVDAMNEGGVLVMSGFYRADIEVIREKAAACGLTFQSFSEKDAWAVTVFTK